MNAAPAQNQFSNAAPVIRLCVRKPNSGMAEYHGREAFALHALIEKGERGVTPIDTPAPRWSHYIYKLRESGLTVETIDEKHGGAFAGTHARYVLRTPLTVVAVDRKNGGAK